MSKKAVSFRLDPKTLDLFELVVKQVREEIPSISKAQVLEKIISDAYNKTVKEK